MILAVDTSGSFAAVAAVERDGRVLFAGAGQWPRAHAEELAPLAREAMRHGPLEHVVAGRGPGSFTGLRVGLAFGQVLAFAAGVPATGVCTLDVVAAQAGLRDGFAVLDARRAEVYLARYDDGARTGEPEVLPRPVARDRVAGAACAGDVELLTATDRRTAGTTRVAPAALASVAAAAVAAGELGGLRPLYLRRPDVTMSAANRVPG